MVAKRSEADCTPWDGCTPPPHWPNQDDQLTPGLQGAVAAEAALNCAAAVLGVRQKDSGSIDLALTK